VFEFLDLRLNTGDEEMRCRDLFTALWIPDEFMRRVQNDGEWTLMCPDECPGLSDVHGDAFDELYRKYESEGRGKKTVRAQELWRAILRSQIETGTPYMLYKDAMQKSNQKHLGVIKSSNLCCEIAEFTTPDETAVCNLASVALPKYVTDGAKFDYEELHRVTKQITRNLDRVIDRNFYPIESARNSNMRHRPIGIGVQGLADVFQLLDLPFDCEESRAMNAAIFETMYHAALEASCELAEELGSYSSFEGSPASEGVLQFDMWEGTTRFSGMYDWDAMRERVKKGLRNSLLLAPMPTASTAQILGNCEAFEPYTQNIYLRRVLAGEFTVVNRHLVRDLKARGLWSRDMKNLIIRANGSIQNIVDIKDDHLKQKYRTVWEIPQRSIIEMAADRGRFIDQSQSMNLFVSEPSYGKLSSMHMFAWKTGLKTGMYYLRTKPKANAQKFTLDPDQNECVACSA